MVTTASPSTAMAFTFTISLSLIFKLELLSSWNRLSPTANDSTDQRQRPRTKLNTRSTTKNRYQQYRTHHHRHFESSNTNQHTIKMCLARTITCIVCNKKEDFIKDCGRHCKRAGVIYLLDKMGWCWSCRDRGLRVSGVRGKTRQNYIDEMPWSVGEDSDEPLVIG
jgi:hypothetical protein